MVSGRDVGREGGKSKREDTAFPFSKHKRQSDVG